MGEELIYALCFTELVQPYCDAEPGSKERIRRLVGERRKAKPDLT